MAILGRAPLGVRDADDLERALARTLSERVEVLNVHLPVLFRHHQRVFEFATANRIAVIAGARVYAQSGALFTFGADIRDVIRHTATYVVRILNGTKPSDLPVQQPTTFELVINLKTAKALGLTIPPSVLIRADAIIQ